MTDDRTLHRLEAFSDIVIGFSLAQLGASLTLTKAMTFDALGVVDFLGAFAIICSLWYFHHVLFKLFFVPKALPVVLNFVWLAVVVLLVFVARNLPRSGFAVQGLDLMYFGLYALAYGILAVQTLMAVREHAGADAEFRLKGLRVISFMSFWTAVFVVCFALVASIPASPALGYGIDATFAAGAFGSVLLGSYFKRARGRVVRDSA